MRAFKRGALLDEVMAACCAWVELLADPNEMGTCRLSARAASPQVGVVLTLLSWPAGMRKVETGPLAREGLPLIGIAVTCTVDESATLKLKSKLALMALGSPG